MALPRYKVGDDIPVSIKLTSNSMPVVILDLVSLRFEVKVNNVEVAKFSIDDEEGYERALAGEESNEVVLNIDRDQTTSWPVGRMQVYCLLVFTDAAYDDGRLETLVLNVAEIW